MGSKYVSDYREFSVTPAKTISESLASWYKSVDAGDIKTELCAFIIPSSLRSTYKNMQKPSKNLEKLGSTENQRILMQFNDASKI